MRLHVDGRDVCAVEVADSRRTRRRGLLGREGLDGALWLPRTRQVHSAGMRFPIDVAHLDRRGVVLRCTTMPPGRLGRPLLRARAVLEAEAGGFHLWGVTPGVQVTVAATHTGASPGPT